MFGEYANSVPKATFQQQLASEGWKYFDLCNLNEYFHILHQQKIEEGVISNVDSLNLSLPAA